MTGLGVWALVDKIPWIGELVGNDLLTGSVYVLLVGGIIVAVIAFFGCVGAAREVKCMLLTVSLGDLFRRPKLGQSRFRHFRISRYASALPANLESRSKRPACPIAI